MANRIGDTTCLVAEQVIDRYDRQNFFHFKWKEDLPDGGLLTIITDEPGFNCYCILMSDFHVGGI